MTLWSETENRRYKSRIIYGYIKICMALGGIEIRLQTETNFTGSLWAHNPNLVKLRAARMWKTKSRPVLNIAHATLANIF